MEWARKEIVNALNTLDLPVIMGAVLTIALTFILINIIVDIIYAQLDPKLNFKMRKQIVAGNWKMNNDSKETVALLEALKQHDCPSDVSVMAPTFVNLQSSVNHLSNSPIEVVAQNMHQAKAEHLQEIVRKCCKVLVLEL